MVIGVGLLGTYIGYVVSSEVPIYFSYKCVLFSYLYK